MIRTLAAFLLMSSAYASGAKYAGCRGSKAAPGDWRVREVHGSDEAKAYMLQMHLAFEGNKLLPVTKGQPSSEFSYVVDPSKDPKQIDLMEKNARSRPKAAGSSASGYRGHLRLRTGSAQAPQRPMARRAASRFFNGQAPGCFRLRPHPRAQRVSRRCARKSRTPGRFWQFGNWAEVADVDDTQPGPERNYVEVDESKGERDALAKIAPKIKVMSSVTGLHLHGRKVTDAGLASLQGINNIEQISLKGTAITDAGLLHLKNMTHVALLTVSDTDVTEAGVASLKKALPQLQVTYLSHAESLSQLAITNAGGALFFDDNGKLIEILFTHRLSDFQLLGLQKHFEVWKTTLRAVDLTNSSITDRGLAALAGFDRAAETRTQGHRRDGCRRQIAPPAPCLI